MAGLFDALFREASGVLTPVPAPAPAAAPQTLTALVASPEWTNASLDVRRELYNRWRREVAGPALTAQASADKKAKVDNTTAARTALREFEKREFRPAEGGLFNNDLLDLAAQGLANAVGGSARAIGTAVGSKGLFDFGTSAIEDARKIAGSLSDATLEKQTRGVERTTASRRAQLLADTSSPLNARLMDLGRRWGGVDKIPSSSPELKALTDEYDRTGGTSFLPEVATAARNVAAAPLNTTANAFGSSAPALVLGAVGGVPGAAVGGALLGAGQGSEAFDRVMALDDAAIMANPELAAKVVQLGGGQAAIAAVRRQAAERASNIAAAINAPIGAAGAAVGARFGAEAAVTRGAAPAGFVRTAATEMGQEGTEGALNQATTNLAVRGADPTQALSAGVAPAAVEEALAGGGMAAALRPFAPPPVQPAPPLPGLSQEQLAAAAAEQTRRDASAQMFQDNQQLLTLEQATAAGQPTMAAPIDNMLRPGVVGGVPLLPAPTPAVAPIAVTSDGTALLPPDAAARRLTQAVAGAEADAQRVAGLAPQSITGPFPDLSRSGSEVSVPDAIDQLMAAVGLPSVEQDARTQGVQLVADLRGTLAAAEIRARVEETLGRLPPRAAERFGPPADTWTPEQSAAWRAQFDPDQVTEGTRAEAAATAQRILTNADADPTPIHPEFAAFLSELAGPDRAGAGAAAVPASGGQQTGRTAEPGGGRAGTDAAVPAAVGDQAGADGAGGPGVGATTAAGAGRPAAGPRNAPQQRADAAQGGGTGNGAAAPGALPQGPGSGLGGRSDGANGQAGGQGPAGGGTQAVDGGAQGAGDGGSGRQDGGPQGEPGSGGPALDPITPSQRRSLERARNRVATAQAAVETARQDVERGRERIGRVQRNRVLNEAREELAAAQEALTRTEATINADRQARAAARVTPAAAPAPFMQEEPAARNPRRRTLYQETVTDGDPISREAAAALERGDLGAALEDLSRTAATPFLRQLAAKLAPILKDGVVVRIIPGLAKPDGTPVFGGTSPSGAVMALNPDMGIAQETVLHESVHAATEMVLRRPEADLTPAQREARAELAKLWRAAKADPAVASALSEFSMDSLSEFVAEAMTNTPLQRALDRAAAGAQTPWARFKQFVLRLIGMPDVGRTSLLRASDAAITALFERPATIYRDAALAEDGAQYATTIGRGRIRRTVDELVQLAEGQASWRDWYDRHGAAIDRLFGEDAGLFAQILSATSQANTVKGNVSLALKAYEQLRTGQPFTGYLGAVQTNLERIKADQALAGPKINAFGEANKGDAEAIAVDRHIAELLFNTGKPNKAQIDAAKRRVTVVAERLGWEPRQVQAALWAANQVRRGLDPAKVQSYDTLLEARADRIAAIRAHLGSGGPGGVPPGGRTDAAAEGTRYATRIGQGLSAQTETPAFKAWFGASKVVDAEGRPQVVYTGTSKDVDFTKFKVPKNGVWFTTDPKSASEYAMDNDSKDLKYNPDTRRYDEVNTASRVMPVYLSIANPATLSPEDSNAMRMASNYRKVQGQIFDKLRAAGYDGVDMGDGVWVVLKAPSQIKSAIGNTGAFDPNKDDIRYATSIGAKLAAATRSALSQHDRVRNESDFLNAGKPGKSPTRAPSLEALGDRMVAAFVDHSIEATNLIDAEARAVPALRPLWARVKDAMITWRNRSDAFFETHKGELVEPYYERLAALAKSSGRRAEDIHREAGAVAQARHALDRTRYMEREMADALARAQERLEFFDQLEAAVAPAQKDKVSAVVGRLRRAAEVGIDGPAADALITESLDAVSALGQVLDDANLRIPKIRELLTGLDAMAVRRARGRNAVDAVRMVESTLARVEELLTDRPSAERAVEKARASITAWETAQTSEPTIERAADGTLVQKLAAPLPGGIRKSVAQQKLDSASPEAQAMADVTRDLFRKLTDLAVANEVLSQEDADFFRRRFPNYVSFMGDSSRDVDDMVGLSPNRGFLEEAEGSQTLGQPAPPLVNLIAKMHQLGNVVGSAELRRGLLDIAMTDQSALVKMAEGLGEKGDARLVVFSEVGGVKVRARIALMDTRMTEGILKTQVLESKAGQALGRATGLYGRLVTQFVPAFAPINFMRDSMTRAFNFVGREELQPGQVNKVRSAFLAGLGSRDNWAQVWDFVRTGEPKGDMLTLRDAGALLLFTDTQVSETKVENEVAKANPTLAGKLRTAGGAGLRVVEQYNRLFEAVIPLATFKALRAVGKTESQAAAITVDMMNFRARGTLTPAFNAAYPFFAAAAQDARQVARTLMPGGKPNVRAWTEMLALAGLAATLYALARDGDEDDEFGGKAMDALTTDHERNWVLPAGDGTYIKVPIGFGIVQLAWNLGVNGMRVTAGIMDPQEAALGMGKAMVKALAPTGVSEIDFSKDPAGALLSTFIPGLAKPVAQVAMNKNFAGGKITYAEQGEKFLSEQGRAATPEVYKDMAQQWREITGQDLAPEQIRVLTEGYLIGPLVALTAMADDRAEKGLSPRGFGGDTENAVAKALGANRLLRPVSPEQELSTKAFAKIDQAKAVMRSVNVEVPKEVERESIDETLDRVIAAGTAEDDVALVAAFLEYKREDGRIRRAQGKLRATAELGEFERQRLDAMRLFLLSASTH